MKLKNKKMGTIYTQKYNALKKMDQQFKIFPDSSKFAGRIGILISGHENI